MLLCWIRCANVPTASACAARAAGESSEAHSATCKRKQQYKKQHMQLYKQQCRRQYMQPGSAGSNLSRDAEQNKYMQQLMMIKSAKA